MSPTRDELATHVAIQRIPQLLAELVKAVDLLNANLAALGQIYLQTHEEEACDS